MIMTSEPEQYKNFNISNIRNIVICLGSVKENILALRYN